MARSLRNLAILVKPEGTEGVDSVPTGAANAIQTSNAEFQPLVGQQLSRDLLLPFMGNPGVFLTGLHASLAFDVEMAGSGVLGTPPAYGSLLKCCGMAEVIDAGVSVAYSPVSTGFTSNSIYFNVDGVRHILLGSRGTLTASLAPQQIPRWRFSMLGLLGTISDQAMPAADLSDFIPPVPVSKANTVLTLFGWTAIAESLALDLGGQISPRMLIGYEGIHVGNRAPSGTAVVEATNLATKDWFGISRAHTKGAMSVVHGVTAGNIVEIEAPKTQLGLPTQGATDNILNYSLPLMFTPDVGNDELTFTFR